MNETPQTFNQPPHGNSNRWTLIAFFLVFTLPVLAAYLALYSGWWQKQGSTEHGQLLVPPVQFNALQLRNTSGELLTTDFLKKQWQLIYVIPARCSATCENSLFLMNQMKLSLGPDEDRVNLIALSTEDSAELTQKLKSIYPQLQSIRSNAPVLKQALKPFFKSGLPQAEDHLYIMDPLGEVMLRYPTYADPKESILQGRGLLKDLKKLLKDSHIG